MAYFEVIHDYVDLISSYI